MVGVALANLGKVAHHQGDPRQVRARLSEGLRLLRKAGEMQLATEGLAYLAAIMIASGGAERAARLFGAVEACWAAMGTHAQGLTQATYDRDRAAARAQLEPAAWERAYREGTAMSLEEAIAYALEEEPDSAEQA